MEAIRYQNTMDFKNTGRIIEDYRSFVRPKIFLFSMLLVILFIIMIWAIAVGSYNMSLSDILRALLGLEQGHHKIVVWDIRMPRILAAIITGCALGLSGLATQSLLRNPIASPFTLGISQGAAFGAAFSIVIMGAAGMQDSALRTADANNFHILNIYAVTFFAFIGAMTATLVILILAPHIGRRLAGSDHGLLIPFSCIMGSLLLLLADTLGRLLVGSGTLPVGVLTSFMGAPLFLYLLIKGLRR